MYRGSPGAFPHFLEIGEILGKPFSGGVWGGTQPAQMPPGYHTIHLGLGESHNLKFRNHSSAKPCFPDPQLARRAPCGSPAALPGDKLEEIPGTRATPWEPHQCKPCLGNDKASSKIQLRLLCGIVHSVPILFPRLTYLL